MGLCFKQLGTTVIGTLLLVGQLGMVAALHEVAFNELESMPNVFAIFYDRNAEGFKEDLRAARAAEKKITGVEFVKVDVSVKHNRRQAGDAAFESPPYLFLKTEEGGIEEAKIPVTEKHITRLVKLAQLPPTPDLVMHFYSEKELYDKLDRDEPPRPAFVMFSEAQCAHCFKARRPFEQAAGFFGDSVRFVTVDCSSGQASREFCDKHGVERVPSFAMMTGESVIEYQGGRSVAEFELFFLQNEEAMGKGVQRPSSTVSSSPAASVDDADESDRERDDVVERRRKPRSPERPSPSKAASHVQRSEGEIDRIAALEAKVSKMARRLIRLEGLVKELMFEDQDGAHDEL